MLPVLLLSFLSILHTGTHRRPWEKTFQRLFQKPPTHLSPSPVLTPLTALVPQEHQHQAALWGVSNANRGWVCSLQGTPTSQGPVAPQQRAGLLRKRVGQTPCTAETWKAMVVEDWPEMPGNWVRPISSHERGKLLLLLFFFGAPDINTLRNSWPRGLEGFWWLLSLKAVRLAYIAK